MASYIDKLIEASKLPSSFMLFFGAQVGHSPSREVDPIVRPGVVGVVPRPELCPRCRGRAVEDCLPESATVLVARQRHGRTVRVDAYEAACICGLCGRSHYDGSDAMARSGKSIPTSTQTVKPPPKFQPKQPRK